MPVVRTSWMRVAAVLLAALLVWWARREAPAPREGGGPSAGPAFEAGQWIEIRGEVTRRIRDDRRPPRHQRFVVALGDGRTLLVAHNIDLAPRVPVEVGDEVVVRGEYEPNAQGGVVHWTHDDPDERRPGGWIRHAGKVYR